MPTPNGADISDYHWYELSLKFPTFHDVPNNQPMRCYYNMFIPAPPLRLHPARCRRQNDDLPVLNCKGTNFSDNHKGFEEKKWRGTEFCLFHVFL